MSNRPRFKICKQTGQNIYGSNKLKLKQNFNKKRLSLFGQLAKHKKMVRKYYGNISEKHLNNIFRTAKKNAFFKNDPLLLLEHRLDIVLLRLNWVNTIFEAKQFILHGNILVNGKLVKHRGFLVKPGDIIQVKLSSIPNKVKNIRKMLDNTPAIFNTDAPDYIEVNYNVMSAVFLYNPNQEDVPFPVKLNPNTIKQLYQI